ncbi:uncharacterized protein GLRG_10232, partial [Colletotrichum graminicola M1.001]
MRLSTLMFTVFAIGVSADYQCYCTRQGHYDEDATKSACNEISGAEMISVHGGDECKLSNQTPYTSEFKR